jgi:predicted Zn-dependent peptidase
MSTSSQSATVSSLKSNFPSLMSLMAEVVLQPALSNDELEKIRKQTLSGIESSKDDADAISGNVVKKLVYGASHPYGEMMTTKTVNSITHSLFYNLRFLQRKLSSLQRGVTARC